ncbi:MAG TPA: NAD(P)H-dependent oxidoreductase [Saprospiraceae bacterium]|nr:NAD(P)H-dependent oxidoreductase [Saprospiraceae bacterium]
MKIHAVRVHPKEDSLNGALFNTAVAYFKSQGHEVSTQSIYDVMPQLLDSAEKMIFGGSKNYTKNWVDRRFEHTEFIQEETALILDADMVYIQTPIWVYQIPSFLKLYIEQIFIYGKFFRLYRTWKENYVHKPLIKDKKVQLSITMGGHPQMVDDMVGGDVNNLIESIKYIFDFTGFDWLEPHISFKTTAPPEEAEDYIGKLESFLKENPHF